MDMSNATAAGPSYGLLDVIFGGKPQEASQADGQGFMPLMELIKAMNDKGKEDETGSRTEEEIATGKGVVDYRVVGMPGMLPNLMMAQPPSAEVSEAQASTQEQTKVGASPAALLQVMKGAEAALAAEGPPVTAGVDPSLVNRLLKEKSLSPLTAEESKILESVNEKIASRMTAPKINGLTPAILAQAAAADQGSEPKAATEGPQNALLAKELAQKGIDPRMVKGQESPETTVAAPEKFLSTEAYMQMHERFTKGQPKEEGNAVKRTGGEELAPNLQAKSAALKDQVVEAGEKGKDLFGKSGNLPGDILKPGKGDQKDSLMAVPFEASLLHSLKGGSEPIVRDVMLPGTSPEQMRLTLTGEVNQGVSLQALKGGGEMKLVIHPEALGEVKLKISTSGGKVEVQVTAQNDEVAKVIRSGSQDLESSLRDQSLALTKFDVSVGDGSPLAATDTRSNLGDQFLSQQNPSQGFSQAGTDDRGFQRWDGDQNQRQGAGPGFMMEEQAKSTSQSARSFAKTPTRDGSRRLDVVA